MCRWIAYLGAAVYLEQFLIEPRRSLVAQARRCREAVTETNGDGFGVGWYGSRARPGVFRDIRPAWGDAIVAANNGQARTMPESASLSSVTLALPMATSVPVPMAMPPSATGLPVLAYTSSVQTRKPSSLFGPKVVTMATSAASRPRAISTRPMRGVLLRGSNVYQRPPR